MPSFSHICHPNKMECALFFLKITCCPPLPFLQKPPFPILCQDLRLRGCPFTRPLCQPSTHPMSFLLHCSSLFPVSWLIVLLPPHSLLYGAEVYST